MDTPNSFAMLALGCAALLLAAALLLFLRGAPDQQLAERLRAAGRNAGLPPATPRENLLLRPIRRMGELFRDCALLSRRDLQDLERTVTAAGFNARRAVPVFIGAKVTLVLVLPAIAYALASLQDLNRVYAAGAGVVLGMMGPNWVVAHLRRSYLGALQRGLPDALDLMVVCAEAGLGLDAAVQRVAQELSRSNRAVAAEFALLAHELRVLPDRQQALARLAERAAIEGLQRLAGTLAQTFRYGTPLAQALRVLAADSRQERLARLEAKAARLPALLVLPLIVFIMPCLFVVLVGPSVVALAERFMK